VQNQIEHHLTWLTDRFPGSYALLSEDPDTDTAVIFVHGFLGDAENTWLNFQEMIDSYQAAYPRWTQTDAFFFSYPSFRSSITDSAEKLLRFTELVFPRPPSKFFHIPVTLGRYPKILTELSFKRHRYAQLIFVGHSEGAILIRRAICLAYKRKSHTEQMLGSKLALFAPAHLGFTPAGWVGACLAVGRIADIALPILSSSPAFVEMKGKELLEQIEEDTMAFIAESPDSTAFRARVLFGTEERFVVRGEYTYDIPETPEPEQSHFSVCKPRTSYERPLDFVFGPR
jgi:pimeloyl-ACP methyl ester carboxylesterase